MVYGSCDRDDWVSAGAPLCRWPVDYTVARSARAAQYISSEWLKLLVANIFNNSVFSGCVVVGHQVLVYDWEENTRIRRNSPRGGAGAQDSRKPARANQWTLQTRASGHSKENVSGRFQTTWTDFEQYRWGISLSTITQRADSSNR